MTTDSHTDTPPKKQPQPTPAPDPGDDQIPINPSHYARFGVFLLLVWFGGSITWAALAPLDSGVPAPGTVVVEENRKTVAHLYGGIVKTIPIHDAQFVEAGDTLITLDDTEAKATYHRSREEYYSLLAKRARLQAERRGLEAIDFPSALTEAPAESNASIQMESQQRFFKARKSAMANQLKLLNAQIETYTADADAKSKQLILLRKELAGMNKLAKVGYVAKSQKMDRERETLDLANQADIARRQATNTQLQIQQVHEDFRKEVESTLATVESQLAQAEDQLPASREQLDRLVITAPVAGYINGLSVHTIGGVIQAGKPLLDIIPSHARLLLDVQVPSHLVDQVHVGQLADIQMSTFVQQMQMIVEGRVISVSADLVQSADSRRPPYFLARVEITPKGMEELGNNKLQAGMPATVIIKTGERTMLEYLMSPLLKRLHVSLTEA